VGASEEFVGIARRVNNWGRWGADDERGTVNLIDAAARRRGADAVVSGQAFQLGLPLSEAEGIQKGFIPGRINPIRRMVSINSSVNEFMGTAPSGTATSEDVVEMALQCATHWDALAHVSFDGRIYNGRPATSVTEDGAAHGAIQLIGPLIGRGVLLDVARAKKMPMLDGGYAITNGDLDAALDLAATKLEPGDIVCVRTGQTAYLALPGRPGIGGKEPHRNRTAYSFPSPGLTAATAEWFHHHDVGALAIDTLMLDVFPAVDDGVDLPAHVLHLVEMGMTQGQNWFLDELADACAAAGRYTFLLDATPLGFTGALGSPVNPVAVL
jgi:kynurenine formamidase